MLTRMLASLIAFKPRLLRRQRVPQSDVTHTNGRARRVRTPTVLQMEAVECGAASLAMVLAYHGCVLPLEELRLACGVSRDGTKASNMLKAARRYGLKAKGFSLEPAQLLGLPLPLIVFWNFNHFVVVEGFGKKSAYINDPAQGPRAISHEEFDQSFTGVALVFEPGPDFVRGGRKARLLVSLRPRLAGREIGFALVFVIVASLALVVPGLVIPALIRTFVDDYLIKGVTTWAWPVLGMMVAASMLTAALTWLQQTTLLRLESRLAVGSAARFFWHVLHLPIEFFTQRYAGEIGSRIAINDQVAHLLSERLTTTALNMVMILFFGVLMLNYSIALTLISVAIIALNLLALRLIARRRADGSQRLLQETGKWLGVTMSGLQMIETIKATGGEADFFTRFAGHMAKVENARQQLAVSTQVLSAVPPVLTAVNAAVILWLGTLRVIDGTMTVGMLVAFQSLMLSFVGPVNSLVQFGSTLQDMQGNLNRLDDVLRYPALAGSSNRERVAQIDANPKAAASKLAGELELREVTFGYSPLDPPLIDKLSLHVKPGQSVALIGSSGSGKSTVARLVAGLYVPWQGEILFDGKPRDEWPVMVMQRSLALVDQDICLFEGTVRENLTLWDDAVPEAALDQATHNAGIYDVVSARQNGYDSTVEEGGHNFSGGQCQRLDIARALTGDPSILILDEATSALDPITEQQIGEQLRGRGCTCLIVAHRLSTIRDCDEIIVLDRGKVVQRGTHAALSQVDGPYLHLIATE